MLLQTSAVVTGSSQRDPQGTCSASAARAAELGREGPPVVAMAGAALRRDLAKVGEGFDVVIIDSPPGLGVPALGVSLAQRVAFGEATLAGQGVVDDAPTSDAAREVRRFTRAVLDVVGSKASEVGA